MYYIYFHVTCVNKDLKQKIKELQLDVKLIEPSSIMVCPLTLEKWEYHQYLIELPLYLKRNLSKVLIVRREMAESFLQHRAIQAGGARPQRDGGDRGGGGGGGGGDGGEAKEQKEAWPSLMDGN